MPLNDSDQIKLSAVVCQAQQALQAEVLELVRQEVRRILEALRDEVVKREWHERIGPSQGKIYRWGYLVRKGLQTTWGRLAELRIPRLRGPAGEIRLIEKFERRLAILAEQLVMGFGQGMSLRGLSAWLKGLGLPSASAANLGAVIQEAVAELSQRRQQPIPPGKYRALVVDGVWGKKRKRRKEKGKGKKQVLLVAVGVLADGRFEVLDWEGADAESAEAYARLLNRLYQRGLETVELIVGDEVPALQSAAELVYPQAQRQVCLYHLQKTLARSLRNRSWPARLKFARAYWRIFDAETVGEAQRKLGRFARKWRETEPEMVEALRSRGEKLFSYFRFPEEWRQRVRTTNLGEGFFRHFRRFLSRFPGWENEEHAVQILATYLLSQEEKERFGRSPAFQLQLNFNRAY